MYEEIIEKWLRLTDTPKAPTEEYYRWLKEDQTKLALDLIQEEFEELKEGTEYKDLEEVYDGAGDLLWVVFNFIVSHNIPIQKVFKIIAESNFSKFCKDEEEAKRTVAAYQNGTHPDKMGEKIDADYSHVKTDMFGVYKIFRKKDGKILKSINFKRPNFKQLL